MIACFTREQAEDDSSIVIEIFSTIFKQVFVMV